MNKMMQNDPVDHFIEQMGLITQGEGSPRISGRIYGLLLVEGMPLTLQEMAKRLQISNASASTNARLLAARDVVRLTTRPGVRGDVYELVPDPYVEILHTLGGRMEKIADQLAETTELFPPERAAARKRIEDLTEFYRTTAKVISEVVRQLPNAK